MVYNWLKGEIRLATPAAPAAWVVSKWGFPPERLTDLFLSWGEVTAPCWPWLPSPNRCWWYFILQMRHFMNYHENKELLQLGGGGVWNGKKGSEGKEWLCRQILHTIESLLAQKKKKQTSEKSCFNSPPLHYLFPFLLLVQNTYKYAALLETASLKSECTFQRLCTI